MQISIALFSIVVFASTAALGEDDCRCWTPSIEDVAALEARIKDRPTPLGESAPLRLAYYGGIIRSGDRRRFIMGKLVPPTGIDAPGIQIAAGKLPPLQGEGCVSNSDADGRWLYFRCARPGAWTPNGAQIAGLEDALARTAPIKDWGSRTAPREWAAYAHHYAGVGAARGDRRIIQGVFVASFNATAFVANKGEGGPGIYIESEAELPMVFDGGCSVVNVTYDPSTKALTARCNGRA